MLKRLAWLALCVCAPLYAAPHVDNDRLQQLATPDSGYPSVTMKLASSAAGAAMSMTPNFSWPPMARMIP
jgi:hypothetical protein